MRGLKEVNKMISFHAKIFDDKKETMKYGESLLRKLDEYTAFVRIDYADIYAIIHDCDTYCAIEAEFALVKDQIYQIGNYCKAIRHRNESKETSDLLVLLFHPEVSASLDGENITDIMESAFCESELHIIGIYFDAFLNKNQAKICIFLCDKNTPETDVTRKQTTLYDTVNLGDDNG